MKTQSLSRFGSLRALFLLPLLAGLLFLGAVPLACSSSSGCEDSKCAAGNKCINTGTTTQCELLCKAQTDCPSNYHCGPTKDGQNDYCQPDGVRYNPKPTGQWGSHCDPAGGLDSNPDCDTDQQFWCYGRNPTDGEAFCTQFQCNSDADCGEDYVCTTINNFPNVQTAKPCAQNGSSCDRSTTTVCLPRTYCLPCATDIDCVPENGVASSCVAGTDGAKFCSHDCQNDGNCPQDATCDQNSGKCMPRAGVCKGTGNICDPCLSDKDCPNGVCVTQEYSGERYCTVKSPTHCFVHNTACAGAEDYCTAVSSDAQGNAIYGCTDNKNTTCDPKNNQANFGCPTSSTATPDISCTIDNSDPSIPVDQCFGLITFGIGSNAATLDGCWTKGH